MCYSQTIYQHAGLQYELSLDVGRDTITDVVEKEGNDSSLNYKDITILCSFISDNGKILPRRITGLKSRQQKKIARLIKQARIAALLPFVIGKI
jgi:small subunit ribosomal protein S18